MAVYKYELNKTNPSSKNKVWWMYEGKYTDVYGNRKRYIKRGFQKKSDALNAERDFLLYNEKNDASTFNMTVEEVVAEYLEYSKTYKRATTINIDTKLFNKRIIPTFGKKRITGVTTKEINAWGLTLIEDNLAHETVLACYKTFAKLYGYIKNIYDISYNPISKAPKPKNKNQKIENTIWNTDDFDKFYKEIKSVKYKAIFRLLFYSGIRRGEMLALKWKHLDGNNLTIEGSITYLPGGWELSPPKTNNSYRTIFIDDETVKIINDYKMTVDNQFEFNDEFFMFGSVRPLSVNSASEYMYKIFKNNSDIKPMRLHDFRHSHATLLIAKGVSVKATAKRLGDTVETVLKTYVHDDKEAINTMNEIVNNL